MLDTTAVTVAAASAVSSNIAFAGTILTWILGSFGSVIMGYGILVIRKVLNRYHMNMSGDMKWVAQKLMETAMMHVEEWAQKQKTKPTSNEKLLKAIETAMNLSDHSGLTAYIKKNGEVLVDSIMKETDHFKKS